MIDAGVIGANRLALLGRQLKVAGTPVGLRAELLAGIRKAAKPLIPEAQQAARDVLPKRGGLNARVADRPMVLRNRLSGPSVGVRITTKTRDTTGDKGVIRHPIPRNRDRWVDQPYPQGAGWFTKTLERSAPKVQAEVFAAMEHTAARISRGV